MIGLADAKRVTAGALLKLIGICATLFAGSALFGQQVQFQGSVPTGVASPTPIALTLRDAIDRGLRNNLGLLLSGQASEIARAERLRSLSALLPQVTGAVSENVQQIDLLTRGIDFHLPGGFSTPEVVGPFANLMIGLHLAQILVWAAFYRWMCFSGWGQAFYFSIASYSTLGDDNHVLPSTWGSLGPVEAVTGILMCGLSVGLLFAVVTRLVDRAIRFSPSLGRAAESHMDSQLVQRAPGLPTGVLPGHVR